MPRPAGLTRLAPVLLAGLVWALPGSAQPHCPLALDLAEAGDGESGLALTLAAPCRPYASVTLAYGPLRIAEQTSSGGNLVLRLPRLAGAESVAVAFDDLEITAAVPPPETPPPGFVALDWGDLPAWGTLVAAAPVLNLGFRPSDGAAPVSVAVGEGPVALRVTVAADTCGTSRRAGIATEADTAPQPLVMDLPPCAASGQVIEIPLR